MKFVLDANMPYSAKSVFAEEDTVVHVCEIGLGDASDHEILVYALERQAVIVTRDLDFANTVLYPITFHAGVAVLRVPSSFTAKQITDFLRWFLLEIGDTRQLLNTLTIIEPNRYRVRKK
jgi:predicted nuclease of predicted toxin-antitoxin system